MEEKDKDWITIFPDWPMAFAWHRKACNADELGSGVGDGCGDVISETEAYVEDVDLPQGISKRLWDWIIRWQDFDDSVRNTETPDWDAEYAIDMEGIEIAKLIKAEIGERYRIRYERCYGYAKDGYPMERPPFNGKGWVVV